MVHHAVHPNQVSAREIPRETLRWKLLRAIVSGPVDVRSRSEEEFYAAIAKAGLNIVCSSLLSLIEVHRPNHSHDRRDLGQISGRIDGPASYEVGESSNDGSR